MDETPKATVTKTAQGKKRPPMGTVLSAGMPRSGSTWQYNATRLLLEDMKVRHWAGWVADYDDSKAPIRLLKVHNPKDFSRSARVVLTTWRPFVECLGSLIRMGWLKPERRAVTKAYHVQRALYHHWAALSHHESQQDQIHNDPEAAIAAIETVLQDRLLIATQVGRPARVAAQLEALRPPKDPGIPDDGTVETRAKRHDARTLLHLGHMASGQDTQPDLDEIARWIADLP